MLDPIGVPLGRLEARLEGAQCICLRHNAVRCTSGWIGGENLVLVTFADATNIDQNSPKALKINASDVTETWSLWSHLNRSFQNTPKAAILCLLRSI